MNDHLQEKINRLKAELAQLSIDDKDAKAHIDKLINEIEDPETDLSAENNFVIDNIKSAIDQFETDHPRATAILNEIMVTLSNMGI